MLKIVPKREEFKWNLPSSMTDYPNLRFKNYIPDKDINEKILTENPVSSNLQEVPQMVSQTVITSDNQMRKIQEKVLQVMGPLPRLWKGLGNV